MVLFIYRDDFYIKEEEWEQKNPLKPYPKGIANVIIAKHRNGPVGQVDLLFIERTARFVNLEMSKGE